MKYAIKIWDEPILGAQAWLIPMYSPVLSYQPEIDENMFFYRENLPCFQSNIAICPTKCSIHQIVFPNHQKLLTAD